MRYLIALSILFLSACSKSSSVPTPQNVIYSSSTITINSVTTSIDAGAVKFKISVSGNVSGVTRMNLLRTDNLTGTPKSTVSPVVVGDNFARDNTNTTYSRYSYTIAILENGSFVYSKSFDLN